MKKIFLERFIGWVVPIAFIMCFFIFVFGHPLNLIGRLRGEGDCMHCKRVWSRASQHFIQYKPSRRMFPLCNKCYKKLPEDKIRYYVTKLVRSWEKLGRFDQDNVLYHYEGIEIQLEITESDLPISGRVNIPALNMTVEEIIDSAMETVINEKYKDSEKL